VDDPGERDLPLLQRLALLVAVAAEVVVFRCPGDRGMADHEVLDQRRHAKLAELREDRAADVVELPLRDAGALVEAARGLGEAAEALAVAGQHVGTALYRVDAVDDRGGELAYRDLMAALALVPVLADGDELALGQVAKLVVDQPRDIVSALASQNQQPHDL